MNALAPVAFFAYKRPWTALQSLFCLSRCPEANRTPLTIYCDAPKRAEDAEGCQLTREAVRSIAWPGPLEIVERTENLGLARSIIAGARAQCARHGKVIVVEDDLLVSRGFLDYMNRGLVRFADDQRVMQISGHQFPLGLQTSTAGLLPVTTSWSWATWGRAWESFEERPDISALRDARVRHAFDQQGAYPFSAMLIDQAAGRNDSWAIRWYWTCFRAKKLALFPPRTLVRNIGFGDGATHTRGTVFRQPPDGWNPDTLSPEMPAPGIVGVDPQWVAAWRRAVRGGLPTQARRAIQGIARIRTQGLASGLDAIRAVSHSA